MVEVQKHVQLLQYIVETEQQTDQKSVMMERMEIIPTDVQTLVLKLLVVIRYSYRERIL